MTQDETIETYEITTTEADQGHRLDKVLASGDVPLSRSRLKALIEEGCVTSNGETITDPKLRVKPAQCYLIKIPEAADYEPEAENIPLEIVFEDDDLLVLNKAAGMVVHPAAGNYTGTLVNALLHHCKDSLSGIGGVKRPGIVHRLDKETSGLMVVAKNDFSHNALAEQFARHDLERAYKALVWGTPQQKEGRIEGNIGRSSQNRKKMAVLKSGGKWAATNYKLIKQVGFYASLIECELETGRTHQIRVHFSNMGHTVVGDALYGRTPPRFVRALNAEQMVQFKAFSRHALHAYKLGFLHPRTNENIFFENEVSKEINDLSELIKKV